MKRPKGSMPFAFSKGAFVRDGHSDGTPFLKQIAEAIDAEGDVPSETERTERLEFSTAILGTSLSRQSGSDAIGGSFTSTKPGGWTVLKLFLADGEAEVYLNINPTLGQGEFATKDPEYGPVVIAEFAKVFLP